MKINFVVAMDENRAIGVNNALPWHLSDDLQLFKSITLNHTIVMGHNTYKSIGKPLPKRTNIILSRNESLSIPGAIVLHSSSELLQYCDNHELDNLYIIGGAFLFREFLAEASVLYLSLVHTTLDHADAYFPEFNWSDWKIVDKKDFYKNERNDYNFTFFHLEKQF